MAITRGLGTRHGRRAPLALGALMLGSLLLLGPGDGARAQQGQGRYLTEATTRLSKLITRANIDGYIFQNNSFSIGGGWLQQGENNWVPLYTIDLQGGRRYRFLASGDFDAKDVDLQVLDLNGRVLAEDVGTEPEAVVNFTPAYTGRFLVRVRLYEARDNLPCLCLGILMVQR